MNEIPCASTIGSIMYVMLCIKLDVACALRVISKFKLIQDKNIGKQRRTFSST